MTGFNFSKGKCYLLATQAGVYLTPSIVYAAHPRYADTWQLPQTQEWMQMILQCRVNPRALRRRRPAAAAAAAAAAASVGAGDAAARMAAAAKSDGAANAAAAAAVAAAAAAAAGAANDANDDQNNNNNSNNNNNNNNNRVVDVGHPETMLSDAARANGEKIDPNIDNSELEWLLLSSGSSGQQHTSSDEIVCYGIMLRRLPTHPANLPESSWWNKTHNKLRKYDEFLVR